VERIGSLGRKQQEQDERLGEKRQKKKKTGKSSLVHGAPSPLGELNPLLNRKKKPNEKKLIIKKV